jgi:hypothetical protein
MNFSKKVQEKYEIQSNVYYVTLNGKDFEHNQTLDGAKRSGANALGKDPKGEVAIEVYSGQKHGSGGNLLKTLKWDAKSKKWK